VDDVGSPPPRDAYRLGDGLLEFECEDGPLRARLQETYGECRLPPGAEVPGPAVRCTVRSGDGSAAEVAFDDPVPLDTVEFAARLFADRGYREVPSGSPGWRLLADDRGRPLLRANGGARCLVERSLHWQGLIGSLAVNRLLRLQPDILFLHAASAAIGGSGVLIVGPKGAGKSTTALALAARGHAFLGDEVAAVRVLSRELLPMRRAVSIRPGPRSRAVAHALQDRPGREELFPDGTPRVRAQVVDLFPSAAPRPATLRVIFFLGPFAERPRAEPLSAGRSDVRRLSPLGATLWGVPPGRRVVQLSQLLARSSVFVLDPGDPDRTAELIERTVAQG
jgi:hypothetical protein